MEVLRRVIVEIHVDHHAKKADMLGIAAVPLTLQAFDLTPFYINTAEEPNSSESVAIAFDPNLSRALLLIRCPHSHPAFTCHPSLHALPVSKIS